MTRAASRVGEGLAGNGDELPVVAGGAQRQLEDSEGGVVEHLGVGHRRVDHEQTAAAGTGDELADPLGRICDAGGRLRGEALVVVVVSDDHDLRSGVVQVLPQRLRLDVGPFVAGTEERMMPVGKRATLRVAGEIRPQPLLLRRADVHRDVAVQRHDMPVAQVVAVVAFA